MKLHSSFRFLVLFVVLVSVLPARDKVVETVEKLERNFSGYHAQRQTIGENTEIVFISPISANQRDGMGSGTRILINNEGVIVTVSPIKAAPANVTNIVSHFEKLRVGDLDVNSFFDAIRFRDMNRDDKKLLISELSGMVAALRGEQRREKWIIPKSSDYFGMMNEISEPAAKSSTDNEGINFHNYCISIMTNEGHRND